VNFLNIGPWELMVILALSIMVMGPKRVVEIARAIGRVSAQMRRLSGEFLGTLQSELQDAEEEVRQVAQDVSGSGAELSAQVRQVGQGTQQALEGEAEESGEDIVTEVRSLERETRGVMQEVLASIRSVVRGGSEDVGEERTEDE
jgi:Sec-independent protein translocase protein TatA